MQSPKTSTMDRIRWLNEQAAAGKARAEAKMLSTVAKATDNTKRPNGAPEAPRQEVPAIALAPREVIDMRTHDPSKGRLPHGSAFVVSYDAEMVLWSGRLTVPVEGQIQSFEASAFAVVTLMYKLDKLYRKDVASRTNKILR